MVDTSLLLMINTIGMSVLCESLKEASYYFTGSGETGRPLSSSNKKNCKESLMFVQGTGLERMLNCYNLAYSGTKIRETFFTIFEHRELIE